jgi:D-inositol-3-phosphate glycosyltransferase
LDKSHKIAFFISSDGWGGLEMNVLRLQRWMRTENYDVILLCCSGTKIQRVAEKSGMPFFIVQKPAKKFDLLNAFRISSTLKEKKIRMVFVCQNYDMDVFSFAKRLFYKDMKLVFHQQMQIGINKKDFVHTFRYRAFDKWISPLNWLKEEIGIRTRFPADRVEVIPLCVEVKPYMNPDYNKAEAREKLTLAPKAPLIGIMGRISPKKGQGFIIRAVEELNKQGFKTELLIVGSATVNDALCQAYDQEIREYVKVNSLQDVIHFRDHMDDAVMFYHAIDIFVMASHGETFGMVTIEAMLSGVPVAGTNSGGTPEILENGRLGYLFEYEDIVSFCEVIRQILQEPEKCWEKAVLAQSVAAKTYTHEREVRQIGEMIKTI